MVHKMVPKVTAYLKAWDNMYIVPWLQAPDYQKAMNTYFLIDFNLTLNFNH